MSWYPWVLFLHLAAVALAFWYAMLIHAGVDRLWRAAGADEARAACGMVAGGERAMPWLALALLATGAWLTQAAWSWSRPWILLSIVGLIALEGVGSAAGKQLRRQATRLPASGGVPVEVAAALRAPFPRAAHYMTPALALGVMLIMVVKPGWPAGIGVLILAAALAAWAGLRSAPAAAASGAVAAGADLH